MARVLILIAALLALPSAAGAQESPKGRTTLDVRIAGGDRAKGFSFLEPAPGEPFQVREDLGANAGGERARKRRSLAYFAQLSDFQLADEESPARVEFTDQINAFFSSAQRPQEALMPFVIDASVRQVNAHMQSPVEQGDGRRAPLGFAILTGDNADNNQVNETEWVVRLLEGGRVEPNSGSSEPADYAGCPGGTPGPEEAARYTGVQDYDDYAETNMFYDPDVPAGIYAGWPAYSGLMDRAQEPFDAEGLRVPSYVAVGNHDGLVQGNEDAIAPFEAVAVGCTKPMSAVLSADDPFNVIGTTLLDTSPENLVAVPPDPDRRFITQPEYRAAFATGRQADAHGFGHVDREELAASRGAATYYDFAPLPGLRFIALDTVSVGGVAGPSAEGNIDHPQFQWLEKELKAAQAADELVVVYSHHAPVSLTADVPDELAQRCQTPDRPQDDPNPGCDLDPRRSTPLHLGPDLVALLGQYPHVIAWVAGHSHVNDVQPYQGELGSFWVLRTSAEADWPHQDRLIEVMDNRDGTLSIFGTLIDNAAPFAAPVAGTEAGAMTPDQLAALARTFGYNDPQQGGGTGEGDAADHNVELLIADPRRSPGATGSRRRPRLKVRVRPRRIPARRTVTLRVRVTANGRPVRGAKVRFANRIARTGRRGAARLRVRVVHARTLRVRASLRGHRTGHARVRVSSRASRA